MHRVTRWNTLMQVGLRREISQLCTSCTASTGTITAQKNDLSVAGANQSLLAIVQAPGFTIRSIDQDCAAKGKPTATSGDGAACMYKGHPSDLAAMGFLQRPLSRRDRVTFNAAQADFTRVSEPKELRRYPYNAKRWRLGVGRVTGECTLEGVSAIEKVNAEAVIFTTGQLICRFRGHQQSKRPKRVNNHACAHKSISEGTEGCLYINAYNNTDSPVRWIRMAGHEALANCKIRRMPVSQGGGLGVYATEDIEYTGPKAAQVHDSDSASLSHRDR